MGSENTLTDDILYQILIDEQGQLKFINDINHYFINPYFSNTNFINNNTQANSLEINNGLYQILPSSRVSFFGLWLHLQPIKNETINVIQSKSSILKLFVFRDSLSHKNYADLNQVMLVANSAIK